MIEKFHRRPAVEFYDIASDPGETENLATNPSHSADVSRMAALLDNWMKDCKDTVRMQHKPYLLTEPYPGIQKRKRAK